LLLLVHCDLVSNVEIGDAMATHTINRVAIYARISTTNHGQDVSMQTRELRDYCERRGWIVARGIR